MAMHYKYNICIGVRCSNSTILFMYFHILQVRPSELEGKRIWGVHNRFVEVQIKQKGLIFKTAWKNFILKMVMQIRNPLNIIIGSS